MFFRWIEERQRKTRERRSIAVLRQSELEGLDIVGDVLTQGCIGFLAGAMEVLPRPGRVTQHGVEDGRVRDCSPAVRSQLVAVEIHHDQVLVVGEQRGNRRCQEVASTVHRDVQLHQCRIEDDLLEKTTQRGCGKPAFDAQGSQACVCIGEACECLSNRQGDFLVSGRRRALRQTVVERKRVDGSRAKHLAPM